MPDPMKFEVRNEEAERMLRNIGEILRDVCPPGFGFSLLVFAFGKNGSMFYTSNAQRDTMIAAMREFIEKFEQN